MDKTVVNFFHFLAQFLFTVSKTELDYYCQNVNVQIVSRVAERLKAYELKKLGNLNKIPEMFGPDDEHPTKSQALTFLGKKL